MMRLFRDGRTETIRSLSIESKEFVLAMEDPSVSREEKRRLHQVFFFFLQNEFLKEERVQKEAFFSFSFSFSLLTLFFSFLFFS